MLNPPRDRSIAWSAPNFIGAGTLLMGAHGGAVDHRVFILCVGSQLLKYPLPDTVFSPTAEAMVNVFTVIETIRQVLPENTRAVPMEHRPDEQEVIRRGYAYRKRKRQRGVAVVIEADRPLAA